MAFHSISSLETLSSDSNGDSSSDETDRSSYIYHRQVEEKKKWDKFVSTLIESGSASEQHTDFIKKASVALKIFTILGTFGMVLAGGVVSKGALIFMVAQMSKSATLEMCPNYLEMGSQVIVNRRESDTVAWHW